MYEDFVVFKKLGLGVLAVKDAEILAGASSYSSYSKGIEIEVDTREDWRRQGLAYALLLQADFGVFKARLVSKLGCA